MSINAKQLRSLVSDTLIDLEEATNIKASDSATELLMLTAAVESDLGTFWYQRGGPAIGIFQMEPVTYNDIFTNFVAYRPILQDFFVGENKGLQALQYDLRHQIIMARIHYLRVREALPPALSESMAVYWKKYYNTELGMGTVEKAMSKYQQYCL